MKTYLLETYRPEVEFDSGGLVIALTPQACYQLDKAGIKYSIIEDYYDEVELSTHEDDYYKEQLQWIDGLDEFLQKNIKELKELNLKLGTIYYLYLKGMVLDPLYIRCYTLRRLFETVKPSTITFVSYPPQETSLDFSLRDDSQSHYSLVTSILCQQNNIPLTPVFLESDIKKVIKAVSRDESFLARLKRVLAKSGMVRRAYFFYKCSKKRLFTRQARQKKLNIFILTTAHLREDFVVDALARGHKIYLLSDGCVSRYSGLGARRHLDLGIKYKETDLNSIWESTANLLAGDDLIKGINGKCQLDVSGIVLPKLKYFISKVCPEILGYFKVFAEFYEKDRVDFTITPYETSPVEFAAVAAASHCKDTKSINLQHGDSVFEANFWNIIWLSRFDIDISSNEEIRDYFRYQCQTNHFPTKLFRSPHRLLPMKPINYLRQKGKGIKKNRIIYLPTMLRGNYGRFDCAHYPDTWYYQFQKALIKYFSTRREYTFVWKGIPASDVVYNPIPDFITDNNFGNIQIATNPFVEYLLSADRVICDYPSTGFYESVVAGVPTISLYHKALKVRQSAVAYFGNLLKLFSNPPEAIKHIDAFLDSNPELYQITLDTEGQSVLDILEEISKGELKNS